MEKSEEIEIIEKNISNSKNNIEEEKIIKDENFNKQELRRFGHTFTLSIFLTKKN
jgi:hypothetical protein